MSDKRERWELEQQVIKAELMGQPQNPLVVEALARLDRSKENLKTLCAKLQGDIPCPCEPRPADPNYTGHTVKYPCGRKLEDSQIAYCPKDKYGECKHVPE